MIRIPDLPVPGVCSVCRSPVRARQPGTWEEIVVWRAAGSGTAYRSPRPTGRVLCAGCQPGQVVGQGELLFDV